MPSAGVALDMHSLTGRKQSVTSQKALTRDETYAVMSISRLSRSSRSLQPGRVSN